MTTRPGPLSGYRVGITSARKVEELTILLERRGAEVESAPVLSIEPARIDEPALRAATAKLLEQPVDMFVGTTGIGIRSWFDAAASWGMLPDLVALLGRAEIIARGPKTVGALRAHGLRELWSPPSECFEDVLAHLRTRALDGRRIVVQEHGQSLSIVADALRRQGADVTVVTIYRCHAAEDSAPVFRMVDMIAERKVDAVTFTSAPAVSTLMEVAFASGRGSEVVGAFRHDVLATCVGPVTAAPFARWDVPTVRPERSRLAAMVKMLETELPRRREGIVLEVAGHRLLLGGAVGGGGPDGVGGDPIGGVAGDMVWVDGTGVRRSGAPLAVLQALALKPGHVMSRKQLMCHLPSGLATSEHAVEVAIARLRTAVGPSLVQTVVKRGYRLPVC